MHLMRTITSVLTGALFVGMALSASAATIKNEGFAEDFNVVSIKGTIEIGDADKFERVIAPLSGATVVFLNSPGGALVDGLDIGISIRGHGYHTAVVGDLCASICGLMWLAGSSRFVAPESKIGFHAAYNKDGTETGQGNALVGAYLSNLGLSYEAIAYLTDAAPDDMHWLTPRAAAKIGITYSLVAPPAASEPQPFMPQQPQYPAAAAPASTGSSFQGSVFQQGLADRTTWENWFAATNGEFHQGAYFWSGQRSLPQPQSCASLSGNYAAGCFAAQSRLSVSDARRRSEPEYRAGWNSYTGQ
jgi:hypothetical protein